jgi:hypothetical protein
MLNVKEIIENQGVEAPPRRPNCSAEDFFHWLQWIASRPQRAGAGGPDSAGCTKTVFMLHSIALLSAKKPPRLVVWVALSNSFKSGPRDKEKQKRAGAQRNTAGPEILHEPDGFDQRIPSMNLIT